MRRSKKTVNKKDFLLTEQEVAAILRRSVSAMRKDRYDSRGVPWIKMGHAIRYRQSDVQKFISDNLIQPQN
jgi:hypothetical protein